MAGPSPFNAYFDETILYEILYEWRFSSAITDYQTDRYPATTASLAIFREPMNRFLDLQQQKRDLEQPQWHMSCLQLES